MECLHIECCVRHGCQKKHMRHGATVFEICERQGIIIVKNECNAMLI